MLSSPSSNIVPASVGTMGCLATPREALEMPVTRHHIMETPSTMSSLVVCVLLSGYQPLDAWTR